MRPQRAAPHARLRQAGGACRVYSTLLLQLVVPNKLLGRVLALELAGFTGALSLASLWSGVAMDELSITPPALALYAFGTGLVVGGLWTLYTLALARSSPDYALAASSDAEVQTP